VTLVEPPDAVTIGTDQPPPSPHPEVAAEPGRREILREDPYLEAEDIPEALSYAAWRAEEVEGVLDSGEAAT
jgi:hypothetical protein